LQNLVHDLQVFLPKVPQITLMETARVWIGRAYPETWWRETCWRLAANVPQLISGLPLRVWRPPGVREWVPVQILRVEPAEWRKGHSRYQLCFKVLAGQACTLCFEKPFNGNWLGWAARLLGFTKSAGARPYLSPYQYASLRLMVLLDPALCRGDMPNFFELRCSGSLLEHNLAVLNRRYRRQNFQCPEGFVHPCHQCAVGYETCPAATHRLTYTSGPCRNCGGQGWFDPEVHTDLCVNCWRKQQSARKV
jgi:hypothetical protein